MQDTILSFRYGSYNGMFVEIGQARSAMMNLEACMENHDPYSFGEPMFFVSSPLAFDLFEAFPFLGMPKPLLCGLPLLIAIMCRRGFFPTKSPIMQTWIMHVIVHCWRL
jgi:hypothetical protein